MRIKWLEFKRSVIGFNIKNLIWFPLLLLTNHFLHFDTFNNLSDIWAVLAQIKEARPPKISRNPSSIRRESSQSGPKQAAVPSHPSIPSNWGMLSLRTTATLHRRSTSMRKLLAPPNGTTNREELCWRICLPKWPNNLCKSCSIAIPSRTLLRRITAMMLTVKTIAEMSMR